MRGFAAALLLALPLAVLAGDGLRPQLVEGKGGRCVEETDFMRRNHMDLLKHQRDDTVHRGIRAPKHSLQGCVDCHADPKTGSVIGSEKAFCQGCHSYAAVKLDCFQCHSPKTREAWHAARKK